MARSGVVGQIFQRGPAFKQVFGPAFLMYYSPAFLRNLAPKQVVEALKLLAEVYRRARELWPLRPTTGTDHSVTIRIDQLKELKVEQIVSAFSAGNTWLLVRKNDREALVEQHSVDEMQHLVMEGAQVKVLKLWRCTERPKGANCDKTRKRRGSSAGVEDGSESSGQTGEKRSHKSGSRASSNTAPSEDGKSRDRSRSPSQDGRAVQWSFTQNVEQFITARLAGGGKAKSPAQTDLQA